MSLACNNSERDHCHLVKNKNKVSHLVYAEKLIPENQTLLEAGVMDGATLTLTFEAAPITLRSIKRSPTI